MNNFSLGHNLHSVLKLLSPLCLWIGFAMIDSPAYAKEDPNISMSKYLIINEGIVAWNPYKIEKTVLNEKEVSEVKDSKKQDVQYFVEIGLRYRKAWFN